MAKRNRNTSESKVLRWIKQGRGQGMGKDYMPWLRIQDVPSNGRVSRIKGIKTNRIHHLMSDIETGYFHILDYASNVLDTREQFPLLPLEQTQDIAESLNIRHPSDPNTKEDIVMTTDFLVTINKDGKLYNIARTVISSSDLEKERKIEKLQIEKTFWEKNNTNWGIVTDNEINDIFIQNIKIVHQYYNLNTCAELEGVPEQLADKCRTILLEQLKTNKPVNIICHDCDKKLGLPMGVSITLFKNLIATKNIEIDILKNTINFGIPIKIKCRQSKNIIKEGVV